jgi:iron(III) transport system permease protein
LLDHSRGILGAAVAIIVFYLVLPPLVTLLFSVFRSTKNVLPFEATEFTLRNIINVFGSPLTYELLRNTAYYAIGTVAVTLLLTTLFAWFIERTNMPFRRPLFVMIMMPMGIPGIMVAMAWVLLANPTNGLYNLALRELFALNGPGPLSIYTMAGMILVTATRFVPAMYMMISGVFARIDPALEEASRTSGVGTWATFRRISAPLLMPALLSAVIYFLVLSIEIFEIAALLGMPVQIFVFSTRIYYAVRGPGGFPDYGLSSTYGLILLIIAVVLIYFYTYSVRRSEQYTTVTGRGYRPRLVDLGRWQYVPVVIISLYFLFAVVIPILMLIWTSLTPRFTAVSLSALSLLNFESYARLLDSPALLLAAKNTLVISTATAFFGTILATLASWLALRTRTLGARLAEKLSFVVLGVPGIVLALSLIFIYAFLPIPIYGTVWIIVIALVTVTLPFGTRLMNAAFMQIHPELEEASAVSGVGLLTCLRKIIIPLIWPSFARCFLYIFVRALRDATIALMLFAYGNQTIAVMVWFLWTEELDFAFACAISAPLTVLSIILTFFVARQTMLIEER